MNKVKGLVAFILIISLAALFVACGEKDEGSAGESDIPTIKDGYFTFGFSGTYKPFNYEDLDGNLTGFEVEIGEAIAEEMGLEPNPVATQDFGALIEEVNTDRLDAIMGSLTITEERAEQVDFSDPYYSSGGMIFVHKDNTDIETPEDLAGRTVGVIASSTHEAIVLEYISEDDLATYQSDPVALQDLAADTKRLDAVMADKLMGLFQIEDNDLTIKAVGEMIEDEEIGAAVKKGNTELLDEINKALEAIIEDGTYDEISQKWFNENILE